MTEIFFNFYLILTHHVGTKFQMSSFSFLTTALTYNLTPLICTLTPLTYTWTPDYVMKASRRNSSKSRHRSFLPSWKSHCPELTKLLLLARKAVLFFYHACSSTINGQARVQHSCMRGYISVGCSCGAHHCIWTLVRTNATRAPEVAVERQLHQRVRHQWTSSQLVIGITETNLTRRGGLDGVLVDELHQNVHQQWFLCQHYLCTGFCQHHLSNVTVTICLNIVVFIAMLSPFHPIVIHNFFPRGIVDVEND